jgi:hypothetical protein
MEKGKIISLRASWSSSGVAMIKYGSIGCNYGWVETNTPFSSRFTFYNSDKYFHTLCNILDAMIGCLCLWLSLVVFEKLLEMLILIL